MATLLTSEVQHTVNKLIETCRDGQNGFQTAAENINDPVLQSELTQYSEQRRQFALDLKNALIEAGETPSDGGSAAAALHRGWINLRQAISKNDRYAILAECERGEDSALDAYRDAMSATLPASIGYIVENQHAYVKQAHDRIKNLRDSAKPK